MSVKLVHSDAGRRRDLLRVPIADATAIDEGDFIAYSGGAATKFASDADNSTFLGIAAEKKVANDGKTTITVDMGDLPVYEVDLDTAAYALGVALRYSAAQKLKAIGVTAAAEMIAICREELPAGSTKGKVSFISRIKLDAHGT